MCQIQDNAAMLAFTHEIENLKAFYCCCLAVVHFFNRRGHFIITITTLTDFKCPRDVGIGLCPQNDVGPELSGNSYY